MPTDAAAETLCEGPGRSRAWKTLDVLHYGRYLLASSSRPGGLPANLQGLWNDSNTSALGERLPQQHQRPDELLGGRVDQFARMPFAADRFRGRCPEEPCRVATRKAFGANTRGWTARTSQNIFGGNGWEWNIPASAWYAQHVYEHWAFTQDKQLPSRDRLPDPEGDLSILGRPAEAACQTARLVAPNGWSPEHGPREDGVMHDQQLIWDLFENYLDAAKSLGIDAVIPSEDRRHASPTWRPNRIGRWGQLQEWQTDRDDPNDTHRHTSHLFAVYPGPPDQPDADARACQRLRSSRSRPAATTTATSRLASTRRSATAGARGRGHGGARCGHGWAKASGRA